jgi:spindle assembly abnormal protein 6
MSTSSIELNRENPLFGKQLQIELHNGTQDCRVVLLTLGIISGNRSIAMANNERLFHFEITDEHDPYFLYVLDIGEQDFHHLKREQSLLVEFNVFPMKLIELLELCLQSSYENASANSSSIESSTSSKFVAKLDTSNGLFSVVESNKFKQLTHISLQCRPGNDSAIKSYLSSRLSLSVDITKRQSQELKVLNEKLINFETKHNIIVSELDQLKAHKLVDTQTMQSNHVQEMSQLQVQHVELLESSRAKHETQIDVLRTTLETLKKESNIKIASLDDNISLLLTEKQGLEYTKRDLTRQVSSLEMENNKISKHCEEVSNSRSEVEKARGELEKIVARSGAKIEAMGQQLLDKDEIIGKSVELQKSSDTSRLSVEARLDMYVTGNDELKYKLNTALAEIENLNTISNKNEDEVIQLREKVKLKSDVIRRMEALVIELREQISNSENENNISNEEITSLKKQINNLNKELEESNENVNEGAKLISSNQEVITYLNEEINKWQLGLRANANYDSSPSCKYGNKSYDDINVVSFSPDSIANSRGTPSNYTSSAAKSSSSHSSHTSKQMYQRAATVTPEWEKDISFSSDKGGKSNSSNNDVDVYLQGLKNLGLGDSFGGIDNLGIGGIDLQSLDYYSTIPNNSKTHEVESNQPSSQKRYSWQDDNYGSSQ